MKATHLCLLLMGIFLCCVGRAQAQTFDSSKHYAIQCQYADGYLGIGSNHDMPYSLYYVMGEEEVAADGLWQIDGNATDGFTITNSSTGQLLTWCTTYSSATKYLVLADKDGSAEQRWSFENESDGYYVIRSKAQSTYYFNLRGSTYMLGCYSGGSGTEVDRNFFCFIEQEGGGGDDGDDDDDNDNYNPKPGYYYLRSAMEWTDGKLRYMFAAEDKLCWDEKMTTPSYVWELRYDNSHRPLLINLQTQGQTGYVIRSSDVSLVTGEDVPLAFDLVATLDDEDIWNIRRDDQNANDYYYLHCKGHENGNGTDGTICGWSNTYLWGAFGGTEWVFEALTDDEVAGLTQRVESITLSATSLTLMTGRAATLTATVLPQAAFCKTVTWSSSNTSVAAVDDDGTVSAYTAGSAIITASAQDGSGINATCTVTVREPGETVPISHTDDFLFALAQGDTLIAIPTDYIQQYSASADTLYATLITGRTLVVGGLKSTSQECPVTLPMFQSYRFNNKYNDQLFQSADAAEEELMRDTIHVQVAQIGKYLTASFTFADPDAKAYVGTVRQKSKQTRQRMEQPVTYTIGHESWLQLQLSDDGDGNVSYEYLPFGRQTTVSVDFLTDHPTGTYGVPRIDIVTASGSLPMSKTTYLDATITIDGGGVYPDMETTDILIKGRGNSSWSGSTSSKNPYHFKFEEKQKPLGMTKGKHWVLLANKQTGSMTCNALEQKASALAGCAKVCHIVPVELYMNGKYRGSYNLTEKVGFSNNSVDIDDESAAGMLELDTYTDEAIWTSNAYGVCTKIHDPDFDADDSLLVITKQDIINDWNAATQTLRYGDSEDYLGRFDVNYLASYLFANELCFNTELQHAKSVFLYSENVLDDGFGQTGIDETPWVFGPMWDCDWSFGYEASSTYFTASATTGYYESKLRTRCNGLWYDLRYKSKQFDEVYYRLWYDFIHDGRLQELLDYANDYYAYAALSLKHNSQSVASEKDGSNYETITSRSVTWLRQRAKYVFGRLTSYPVPLPLDESVQPQLIDGYKHPTGDDDDALRNITPDMASREYYDLSGRRIPAGALRQHGIYVEKGRKVYGR